MSDDIERLRDAIARYAQEGTEVGDWTPEACREVFAEAQIELTEDQHTAAAKAFRKLPFFGGSYTLDAKRLLKAVGEVQR